MSAGLWSMGARAGSKAGSDSLNVSVAVTSVLLKACERANAWEAAFTSSAEPSVAGASRLASSGSRLSVNSRACENGAGAASPRVMITRAPSLEVPHNCLAKASGRRMQPCEAGWLGTTPWCIATPDQVMRCM